MISYGLPDGAEVLRRASGGFELAVSMPTGEDEFFGHGCPSCQQHFRIAADGYHNLPDGHDLWGVYYRHRDEVSVFITAQQLERARGAASDYEVQLARDNLHKALGDAFGRPSRQTRNSFIRIVFSTDPKPLYPGLIHGIGEERLARDRVCDTCGLRYAGIGEHRFCPVWRKVERL